jgi:translation initiation factor 2A
LIVANIENLAKKKDIQDGKKFKPFYFDGFEFIPVNPEVPPQFAP